MHIKRQILLTTTIFLLAAGCKNSSNDAIKAKRNEEKTNKENRVSPPSTASNTIGKNMVTVSYSSPSVKGRPIWGALVPYNEVWRTGANEATMVTFTQDVQIQGQTLTADTYALFSIPTNEQWTLIFNYEETQWGAFKYEQSEDALRVQVMPVLMDSVTEQLTFFVERDTIPDAGILRLQWEKLRIDCPFSNIPEPAEN